MPTAIGANKTAMRTLSPRALERQERPSSGWDVLVRYFLMFQDALHERKRYFSMEAGLTAEPCRLYRSRAEVSIRKSTGTCLYCCPRLLALEPATFTPLSLTPGVLSVLVMASISHGNGHGSLAPFRQGVA